MQCRAEVAASGGGGRQLASKVACKVNQKAFHVNTFFAFPAIKNDRESKGNR